MHKNKLLLSIFTLLTFVLQAQIPIGVQPNKGAPGANKKPDGPGGFNQNDPRFNVGHFSGKIVDSLTNKGIGNASVQLLTNKFDPVSKKMTTSIVKTILSESNGDFSFEGLNLMNPYTIKISIIGYLQIIKPIKFDVNLGGARSSGGGFDFNQMANIANKDLGNLKLKHDEVTLQSVDVNSSKTIFELGVDRKIFNVGQNIVTSGQTAVEVMKNIPSINVDIDGKVTLRNASPTIYIDGKPTFLTLDQIPADIIEKVEIITNPSAKFDAGEGANGIVNIVLKKNRKKGYNGSVNAGVDVRGKQNYGLLLNLRSNKFNYSIIGTLNQRKSIGNSIYDRTTIGTIFPTTLHSNTDNVSEGEFRFLRAGIDYFPDNRNTLSIYGIYVNGKNNQSNIQRVDSTFDNGIFGNNGYNTLSNKGMFEFKNYGTQVSFKHNFPKSGHFISSDIYYNSSTNENNSATQSNFYKANNSEKRFPLYQLTDNNGNSYNYQFQIDYENPLTDKIKIDVGFRYSDRYSENISKQLAALNNNFDVNGNPIYLNLSGISNNFINKSNVFAAYGNLILKDKKWSYQFGLRVENRNYNGINKNLLGVDTNSFTIRFPLNLLPSAFITYKLNDQQDLQFNYSRKVNSPNFFQLNPFPVLSDPYNIQVGNTKLNNQVNNIFEIVYNNAYKQGANFFASIYFRYATDLITSNTYRDISPLNPNDTVFWNSYINANSSSTYGLELSERFSPFKWWDCTLSLNTFNSTISTSTSNNSLTSWNAKMNNSFKVAKGWSIQFSGQYVAKTVLPPSSSAPGGGGGGFGGGGGGGGQFGAGVQSNTNGYNLPRYDFDLAVKRDITWKNGTSLAITLSVNDVFKTELFQQNITSSFFTQNSTRYRDQQIFRINIRYQFGKFDLNILKRKNNKVDGPEIDGGGGGGN